MAAKILMAFSAFLAACAVTAYAGKCVGEINYFSGDVSIIRQGTILGGGALVIGGFIEDFDLIKTGADGTMDLTLKTPQKQRLRFTVRENTSFSVETAARAGGRERLSLYMMSGTLACKVDALAGNELSVKTKSTAMGVKGTAFTVTSSPADDIFITCLEGAVACRDEETGEELVAVPGKAVERLADEKLVAVKAPADREGLELFRQQWLSARLDVFRRTAARRIMGTARLFQPSYQRLRDLYARLQEKMPIIKKWIDDDAKGVMPSPAESRKEKVQVLPVLLRLKTYLTVFEPLYYRLNVLEYYYGRGYGSDDASVQAFFSYFKAQKEEVNVMIGVIRYSMRLYADRNEGYFPFDELSRVPAPEIDDTDE